MTNASPAKNRNALVFGLGFSGRAIARQLEQDRWSVVGTTRDGRDGTLRFEGKLSAEIDKAVGGADLVISTVPPQKNGRDPVLDALGGFSNDTTVIYLSATSVYGDRDGGWAFEAEPPRPLSRRGFARAEAELRWLETGAPVHILRCAGIYGPGRSVLNKLDRAVVKPGHVVNRIHVDDIAELVARIADAPDPGIYNVADGHPAPPQDVVDFAAGLVGCPAPPRLDWTDPSLSEMARSFYAETKHVDITKARETFGWKPAYPTYREGLRAVLAAERGEGGPVD